MNRIVVWLFLILISISGCTIPLTCDLYNNTTQPLKIIKLNGGGLNSEQEFKANSIIKLESWELINYKILSKNESWSYNQIRPSSDLVRLVGFTLFKKRVFRAQIERDGRIFVLKTDNSLPASELGFQPEGFPLIPKIETID